MPHGVASFDGSNVKGAGRGPGVDSIMSERAWTVNLQSPGGLCDILVGGSIGPHGLQGDWMIPSEPTIPEDASAGGAQIPPLLPSGLQRVFVGPYGLRA